MQKSRVSYKERVLFEVSKYLDAIEKGSPFSRFHLTGLGPVKEIEEYFSKYYSCGFGLSFSSATNALTAVALFLDLQEGDEVIIAPHNWGSSIAGLVEFTKAKLVIAEADDNGNIDTRSLKELTTHRTKAIWACDFEGHPHNTVGIRRFCNEHQLVYVADAAQSFGQHIAGLPASALADAIVLSFGSGKPIDAGEGGMLVTKDKEMFEYCLRFQHPYRSMIELGIETENELYPINGRISPISAIIINEHIKQNPCTHHP